MYDAHQRPVFAFAFYLTKSRDIAEEITQEAFIRLWEKRTQLGPDTYLLAYLKKITQNLVLDLFRKANRDRNLRQQLYTYMSALESENTDQIIEKELNRAYRRALETLPPQQRIVFMLHRDENLTYQEIADHLQLSKNTVRNHMAEAIRSVRHYVEHNADLAWLVIAIIVKDNAK
jgi:RNA polymerase sigma-70 factor (ECF subfamily)